MIIQKKYYMIVLLSISSISYGMEFFADLIARDPLALYAAKRESEMRKTTQHINNTLRAAAKMESQSNGHYGLVEKRGVITVVRSVDLNLPKPKL